MGKFPISANVQRRVMECRGPMRTTVKCYWSPGANWGRRAAIHLLNKYQVPVILLALL